MMKLAVYGSGNTAWVLTSAFANAGLSIHTIVARNQAEGKELALARKATYTLPSEFTADDFDVVILAVSDSAIRTVASSITGTKAIIAHTSGPTSIDQLNNYKGNVGVFYPLQTMTKDVNTNFTQVPLLIEGSNDQTLAKLKELASVISSEVRVMSSSSRLALHASAVFMNNFVNHINATGQALADKYDVPFELLLPLIEKTAELAKKRESANHQTGPAIRRDVTTIEAHLKLLNEDEQTLYRTITDSIQKKNETEL